MAITKNVCTYDVQVLVFGVETPFEFADDEGINYGTLAYQSFMSGGDVQSKLAGDSVLDVVIPRTAIAAFIWSKSCDEAEVTNDIC